MASPYLLGHSASAPVSHTLRWRQGGSHNIGYFIPTNRTVATRFGLVFPPFYAVFHISLPRYSCHAYIIA